jgi:RNA polymerase sigma-70 factor (ECF subfamily)
MSTSQWHLPDRPDALLDFAPEQDVNATFLAMVYQYSAMLNRVARSVTRDASDAEDFVQETFLRTLVHHNKLPASRYTDVGITWNLAPDSKRRPKKRRQAEAFDDVAQFLATSALSAERR